MTCDACRVAMERMGRVTAAGWEYTLWQCPKCKSKKESDAREVNR